MASGIFLKICRVNQTADSALDFVELPKEFEEMPLNTERIEIKKDFFELLLRKNRNTKGWLVSHPCRPNQHKNI
jgi:hypothetical protein